MILAAWALGLASVYTALLAYIYITQDRRFFPSDGEPFGEFEGLRKLGGKALRTQRQGQDLRYYLIPAQGQARGWALLFHGNRHGARERFDYAEHLAPLGLNVVLAEYPGYALAPGETGQGSASEPLVLRQALALADEVIELAGGLPVLYFGESLGTGPATYVAMRRPGRGLMLSTPYTTMADVAAARFGWLPVGPFVHHRFPAWRWAPHVACPVLVLHGTLDETIPFSLGTRQAARFKACEVAALPGRGHGDLREAGGQAFWGPVARYVEERLKAAA